MTTPNPRKVLSRKLRTERNSLTEDVTIRVRADGTSDGDMNINQALDFVMFHSRTYAHTVDHAWGGNKRPPKIVLRLLEGEHSVDSDHMRLQGIKTTLDIEGPDLSADTDAPLAVINLDYSQGASSWWFEECSWITLNNVRIEGSVEAYKWTNLDINMQSPNSSGWHVIITGTISWTLNSAAYTVYNLTTGGIMSYEHSQVLVWGVTFTTELNPTEISPNIGILRANNGGMISLQGVIDCSDWGLGSPASVGGTNAVVRADLNAIIIIQSNLDLPNVRTGGTCAQATFGSKIIIDADVNWNSRAAGDTKATTLQADGSFYNVTGTETL